MSLLGNIIWLIFGGLLAAIGYILGGLLMCLTIVGIPFGLKAIQFGFSVLTPFGKETVPAEGGTGCIATVLNLIWLIFIGWETALVHVTFGIILAITIIGIPFARQHFKLIPVALLPFSFKLETMAKPKR